MAIATGRRPLGLYGGVRFYQSYVLPSLTDLLCGLPAVTDQRRKIVPMARGTVLEIGIGSGRNLAYYDPHAIERLWGLEPSEGMRRLADKRCRGCGLDITWLSHNAESIPLDNSSVDAVVVTYTLCTVTDLEGVLSEIRRVLRPQGTLLFCEHGVASDSKVRAWQERVNPFWRKVAGGCNLTRDIPAALITSGFALEALESTSLPYFPRIAGQWHSGRASLT